MVVNRRGAPRPCQETLNRGGGKVVVKIINKAIVSVPFIWIALSLAFLNIFFLFLCVIT